MRRTFKLLFLVFPPILKVIPRICVSVHTLLQPGIKNGFLHTPDFVYSHFLSSDPVIFWCSSTAGSPWGPDPAGPSPPPQGAAAQTPGSTGLRHSWKETNLESAWHPPEPKLCLSSSKTALWMWKQEVCAVTRDRFWQERLTVAFLAIN